jgi:hypothetical protein
MNCQVLSNYICYEAFFWSLEGFIVGFSVFMLYYEHRIAVLPQKVIHQQPANSAVAISERMNLFKNVMRPNGKVKRV